MSHKRVSQLVELGVSEVESGDLFYIIDVSAKEGKKIQMTSLADYLAASGSLNAITATNADTASFVFGYNVFGPVTSSLTSDFSTATLSASWASQSLSSSVSITASYAISASGGTSISSSWASQSLSSSFSNLSAFSSQSAFLVYSGGNNGTASYAINTLNVISASYSKTASYVSGLAVESSSYSKTSSISNQSITTSFLNFDGNNNGTASYALVAGGFNLERILDYGLFLATSQSISSSQLDNVEISSSLSSPVYTIIDVKGTSKVLFTSSVLINETLNLVLKDRDTGIETILDSTPVYFDVSRTVNAWDDLMSGSVNIPYSLAGSGSIIGNFMIFVTSSASTVEIDSNRLNRFNVSSRGDNVSVSIDEPLQFLYLPSTTEIEFSSSAGGPFTDSLAGILTTGSTEILNLYMRNESISNIRYVWDLVNLKTLDCGENIAVDKLTGMPDTLESLICDTCSLSQMTDLSNTTMSYFNCSNNQLTSLPNLPTSLSYMNCSQNDITSLPTLPNTMSYLNAAFNSLTTLPFGLPSGLTELYMNDNDFTSLSITLPTSLITMSFSNNTSLNLFDVGIPDTSSTLPTSLEYLDISYTQISTLPNLPTPTVYFDAISCSLTQVEMDKICSQSLVNGQSNGYLYLNGNGLLMISTVNDYILPLQSDGWTIGYDGAI